MLALAEHKQLRPQQKLAGKIEAEPCRSGDKLAKLSLGRALHLKHRSRRRGFEDQLARHAERVRKDGAQALVTLDQVAQRSFQRRLVERAREPQGKRNRVGRAPTFQAIEEPQPALRKRQRKLGRTGTPMQRRPGRLAVVQALGQRLHGRGFEQRPDGDLDIERGADPADQPHRQQRMAAEREEVVVGADPLQPQHLGKQPAQDLLLRGARRARLGHAAKIRGRKRPAVELAVRGQRQPIEQHKRRRHHVVGQPLRKIRPQRCRIHRPTGSRNHIGHQPLVAGLILTGNHRRLANIRAPRQRRLDLAGLDPEPAQLHLIVGAPQKLQHPVRAPARQIPGPVHPAARRPEPVRHKPLRRQSRPSQITPRQPRSGDVKLPRNPSRNRLQTAVKT